MFRQDLAPEDNFVPEEYIEFDDQNHYDDTHGYQVVEDVTLDLTASTTTTTRL